MRWTFILIFVVLLSLLGNVLLLSAQYTNKQRMETLEQDIASYKYNDKALIFSRLFIEKVLKAEGEVSFETRLELENRVRELDDQEVLTAWNTFVDSKTESEAQDAVKELLYLLVTKVKAN